MNKHLILITITALLVSTSSHAIDEKYRKKLDHSGCTQVTEMQGCDINKSKAENTKAGFGQPATAPSKQAPHYKDLVGKDSIGALDKMTERGFKSVDTMESGSTQYAIFYNTSNRLCVQFTMADGKVLAADDIHTHPKCH